MKLLVTRPVDDAQPLAEKLEGLGHEAIVLPLLEIVARENITLPDGPFQALTVSSANGLLAKVDLTRFHHTAFFAIGPQSAQQAKRMGFENVHDKGGNVEGLARTICKSLKPQDGPILYLSGAETTGDLEGKLKAQGFTVMRAIVYDALPRSIPNLAENLDGIDGVLLYSPRSAKLWVHAVTQATCEAQAMGLIHYCLSANVAANVPKHWPRRTAKTPDENGMLTLLDHTGEAD
jgi:uroporphyrinogen-III synthase